MIIYFHAAVLFPMPSHTSSMNVTFIFSAFSRSCSNYGAVRGGLPKYVYFGNTCLVQIIAILYCLCLSCHSAKGIISMSLYMLAMIRTIRKLQKWVSFGTPPTLPLANTNPLYDLDIMLISKGKEKVCCIVRIFTT